MPFYSPFQSMHSKMQSLFMSLSSKVSRRLSSRHLLTRIFFDCCRIIVLCDDVAFHSFAQSSTSQTESNMSTLRPYTFNL